MLAQETILDLLRRVRFSYDGEEGWICTISGEEDLWAGGKTPEDALAALITLLAEEAAAEEEDSYQPPGSSLDPGIPSPFGIPWRWILLPALFIVLLWITLVVQSPPAPTVPTPSPVLTQWSAPLPPLSTWESRDLERELQMERRLREIERQQELCNDPDLPPHLQDRCR
jgi:predicted RNase H-like HicB family nuclease